MKAVLVRACHAGAPQGSPLSPLLANLVLHELDLWLGERGIPFVRYADDIVIPISVHSQGQGERLQEEISERLSRLGLELNREKTALTPWTAVNFLGFSFAPDVRGLPSRRISLGAERECMAEIERLALQPTGCLAADIGKFLHGWAAYYRFTEEPTQVESLYAHARQRVASVDPSADLSALVPRAVSSSQSVDYGGHVRATAQPGHDLRATLRCWATKVLRNRLVRCQIDIRRPKRGSLLPRLGGVRVLIGGHHIRFRL